MGSKISKKTPKAGGVPSPKPDDVTSDLVKKKNKKKRKKKLPKNYNPNIDPDPERWLPRRERTGFKKRKDR
jgi:signal recognition particle subunit SRP72